MGHALKTITTVRKNKVEDIIAELKVILLEI